MDISRSFAKKRDLSDQSNNGKVDNKRTHRLGNPKQNKNKPRPVIIKFVRHNFTGRIFLNKKKLKNIGISIIYRKINNQAPGTI